MTLKEMPNWKRRAVQESGLLFETIGIQRSAGKILGLLFLSEEPLSLTDISESLKLSKGSVSICVRILVRMGAIERLAVRKERGDFFKAHKSPEEIVRCLLDALKFRASEVNSRLASLVLDVAEDEKTGALNSADAKFCRDRVESFVNLERRIREFGEQAREILLIK
jgi:DNA-binding transcriptional regulator GbsR (MarR family)